MAARGEALKFLMSHLEAITDECIIWPYAKARGYGRVLYMDFVWPAHRLVCYLVHGEAPSDTHQAAHRCGNPSCINHAHVRWATPEENQGDRIIHGTQHRRQRLLTDEQVRYVRSMFGFKNHTEIAKELGVHQGSISAIFAGKTYQEVT